MHRHVRPIEVSSSHLIKMDEELTPNWQVITRLRYCHYYSRAKYSHDNTMYDIGVRYRYKMGCLLSKSNELRLIQQVYPRYLCDFVTA